MSKQQDETADDIYERMVAARIDRLEKDNAELREELGRAKEEITKLRGYLDKHRASGHILPVS